MNKSLKYACTEGLIRVNSATGQKFLSEDGVKALKHALARYSEKDVKRITVGFSKMSMRNWFRSNEKPVSNRGVDAIYELLNKDVDRQKIAKPAVSAVPVAEAPIKVKTPARLLAEYEAMRGVPKNGVESVATEVLIRELKKRGALRIEF